MLACALPRQIVPQDPTDEVATVLLTRFRAERVESSKKPLPGARQGNEINDDKDARQEDFPKEDSPEEGREESA